MKAIAKLISVLALGATIVPSLLYFGGVIGHEAVKVMAIVGTVAWFIATPAWMGDELPIDSKQVEI